MLIKTKHSSQENYSAITPQEIYHNRRDLIKYLSAAGVVGTGFGFQETLWAQTTGSALASTKTKIAGGLVDEKITDKKDATTYNNYYEFGTDKADPAKNANTLITKPWSVAVEGMVKKPGNYNLEDIMKMSAMEERVYRLRCVEGWSMVIPWIGFSFAEFIKKVEPTPGAKYVEFITLADPKQMPGLRAPILQWPYTEGLRLDEAQNPLTLLTFGMYNEVLPKQNGAPLRIVVPWKYGFKSGKSIVKIRFTDKEPSTAWNKAAANEYGFYSNVNPNVDHPRWSQATERRIGEGGLFAKRRPTLMFNGYEAQVGQMYAGMDLKKFI